MRRTVRRVSAHDSRNGYVIHQLCQQSSIGTDRKKVAQSRPVVVSNWAVVSFWGRPAGSTTCLRRTEYSVREAVSVTLVQDMDSTTSLASILKSCYVGSNSIDADSTLLSLWVNSCLPCRRPIPGRQEWPLLTPVLSQAPPNSCTFISDNERADYRFNHAVANNMMLQLT